MFYFVPTPGSYCLYLYNASLSKIKFDYACILFNFIDVRFCVFATYNLFKLLSEHKPGRNKQFSFKLRYL